MIYFIQDADGDIKIGTASNVAARLDSLRSKYGDPSLTVIAVMEGSFPQETSLHKRFASLSLGCEWFSPGTALLEFMADHGKPWDAEADGVKFTAYVPERIRRAYIITSAISGRNVGDILTEVTEGGLPDAVAMADKAIAEGAPPAKGKPGPKSGKGRKPKDPPA